MSAAVSVRSMLARSPTLISSNVRLRMASRSDAEKVSVMVVSLRVLGEDVEAAVDVVDVAGDGACRIADEERAQRPDVIDLHFARQRRPTAGVRDQVVEAGD